MTAMPVVTRVSQATRAVGSWANIASRIASDTWSATLSGCPSDTDSEVKMNFSAMTVDSSRFYINFHTRIILLTRKNIAMPLICQAKIGLATIPFDFMEENWAV